MNMDILKSFTEQMQGFASPLTRYNQLLASNIEQLTRLQLAATSWARPLGSRWAMKPQGLRPQL